jgi:hypothetical protein
MIKRQNLNYSDNISKLFGPFESIEKGVRTITF